VRFGGLEGQGKEVVDYLFVSRLWTVGRTLDEIVGKHEGALKGMYSQDDLSKVCVSLSSRHRPCI
jgi:hypothetical protein